LGLRDLENCPFAEIDFQFRTTAAISKPELNRGSCLHSIICTWSHNGRLNAETTRFHYARKTHMPNLFENAWQDFGYAARLFRLNKGFFTVATLSLALV
jgi:hypothetical protein